MEPWQLDGTSVARLIAKREMSARECVESHLDRIDSLNPHLNAIVRRTDDDARRQAADVDAGRVTGSLAGAVMTTKINTDHVPHPSDNGIKALAKHQPTETHPGIAGLIDEGLMMVGRTNSPAFAMRFHTANDLHGETLNPYDKDVSCGGSSGGAGVAVATGMCQIAQGNDIAGSIRWPATLNGVIGLRPTVGRIPSGGTNPSVGRGWGATNMSTNGPLARTMTDIRAAFYAMSANNWSDPNWVPVDRHFANDPVLRDGRPIRVGLVTHDGDHIDPHVLDAVRRAGVALEDAGYVVEEVSLPMTDVFFGLWERLGTFDIGLGLAPLLKDIDDSGLQASIADWVTTLPEPTPQGFMSALVDRDLVMRAWTRFLAEHHIVVSPLMSLPSIPRGFDIDHPGAMAELIHIGRWGMNLSAVALPALAFPTGKVNGVPIGVQMFSRAWREDLLLDAGAALETRFGAISPTDRMWDR
ncbi:MAG: amidase family protein [Actinomycetota bacterium]